MSGAPEVVVIGSLNMDLVVRTTELPARGETVTGGTFEMHGGGKGANQAVAAARAGASVALVGAVGADDFGVRLLDELAAEGMTTTGVITLSKFATGVATIVVDGRGENQIAVASGANHGLRGRDVERAWAALDLRRAGCALFCLEVEDEVVRAGARLAAGRGMTVVLNPAPARALPPGLVELRPMLTPNRGEAAELTGLDDPARAAQALAAATAAPALVTAGAQGVFMATEGGVSRIEAPSVPVRDTTGAGDTFNGALAAGLARGWALERSVRWATAASALSTATPGARGGMPTASQIEAKVKAGER